MLIHSIFMPSNRFLWFTQCPSKIQNRGEKHVKIQSYKNLRTRYTPYYPGTLSGKVNIQWGIYQACEIVTNIRYPFSLKDLIHSYALEILTHWKNCTWFWIKDNLWSLSRLLPNPFLCAFPFSSFPLKCFIS